jgi:hypothetical protein
MKVFSSAWLELKDISRASDKEVLALELRAGLFSRALVKLGAHNGLRIDLSALGDQKLSPQCQYSVINPDTLNVNISCNKTQLSQHI